MQHEPGIPWRLKARQLALWVLIRGLLVVCGLIMATGVLEVALRVHNPFETRIIGDKIVLPANRTYEYKNDLSEKLDGKITHTKNSLGFRGDEPPDDFNPALTVVTVGGSTTESIYLSDGKTWSDELSLRLTESFRDTWLNNAGLDGHSTYGHLVLMTDHVRILQPDIAIFLVGLNDRSRNDPATADLESLKSGISLGSAKAFVKSLSPYSEAVSLALNAYRTIQARSQGLNHTSVDLQKVETVPLEQTGWQETEILHRERFLPGFERRLAELVQVSRSNGIEPVFVTQPALFGNGIDGSSGVDLRTVPVSGVSGQRAWDVLELYNQVTRKVGERNQALVIDLASKLEKNARYYYDYIHFTNDGSAMVGELIWEELCPFLSVNFSSHAKRPCDT